MRVTGTAAAEDDRMPWSGRNGALRTAAVRESSTYDFYNAWREAVRLLAGMPAGGPRIQEQVCHEPRQRVIAVCVVRKLFPDWSLVRYAADPICTCENYRCRRRGTTKCRSYLRLQLACNSAIYTIDLEADSVPSFVQTQTSAFAVRMIVDASRKFTARQHGNGGEVNSARV